MTEREKNKIFRKFTNGGCKKLNFEECESLHQKYIKAINAPGCSSCAKRRARHKFRRSVRQALENKNFNDVWQED